jgi:tetratricopeptide (TPR) repeat protein
MADEILKVFLSSTARDLEAHRAAVHAELTSTGLFYCIRQEDFGPQDASAVEFCRDTVKASAIFVGLIGQRRGWEPDGDNGKRSITEMEHDWARDAGSRRFLYVTPDDFPVPGNVRDTDEQYARQQVFRKRVMDSGERIVSQKGFDDPKYFAAEVVKHLLLQRITGKLIDQLGPKFEQGPISSKEQQPAIAAAMERLADDDDVNLLALAIDPNGIDVAELEGKLRQRAEKFRAQAQPAMKASAEYWRHIGALAFLHDTLKSIDAYQRAVASDPDEPEGWRYLGELQYRRGDLAVAEQSFNRVVALGKLAKDPRTEAIGCLRLGWILFDRGDLTKAEVSIADAIKFAKKADWQEGLARAYCNLGLLHESREDYDEAETLQRRSLAIEIELGNKQGIASSYANLGNIHIGREQLEQADKLHREAFSLSEELGDIEGVAQAWGNLGIIHQFRGELDEAEAAQRKSLAIYRKLGSKDGMARAWGNLAPVYKDRGDLDKAEDSVRKSLALYEKLGSKEGIADAHVDLGFIHEARRRKAAMCECWRKARDLYKEMGLPKGVAEMKKELKRMKCRP